MNMAFQVYQQKSHLVSLQLDERNLFDFIIIKSVMLYNFSQKKDLQENNKSPHFSRFKDQKQQYFKKIKYQAHKLTTFYNQSTVPTKKQDKQCFLYQSAIQIKSPLDLILSIEDVLNIDQKRTKMMLPSATHTCFKKGLEMRLGLEWGYYCRPQDYKKQQQILIESLGSQKQIKSVQTQKKPERTIFKINLYNLSRWLRSKMFQQGHHAYVLFISSEQQKSISFLHDRKIDFIQISSNQYLVYPEFSQKLKKNENQLKQEQFYDDLFGSLFNHRNNFKVNRLSPIKIKEILDKISQNGHSIQFKTQNKKFYEFPLTQSNYTLKIVKERRQDVREFLLFCLQKTQQYNRSKIRSFGSHSNIQKRLITYIQELNIQKGVFFFEQADLLTVIEQANQELRVNGFFSLVRPWKYVLKTKIQDLLRNFQMCEANLKDQLLLFVRLHQLNFLKIQQFLKKSIRRHFISEQVRIIYETIYPQLNTIIQSILQKFNGKKMKLLQQMFKQLNKNRGINSDQLQTEFISTLNKQLSCPQLIPKQKLILQKIKQFVSDSYKNNQNKSDLSYFSSMYFAEIQNERLMNNRCIGCATFLYQYMNAYEPNLHQIPLKFFNNCNVHKDNNTEFIENVCGILNCGGGVILMGFQTSHNQFKCVGKTISQNQKQMIEDRINAVMNLIYPKIDQSDWTFNFVPVFKNPLAQNTQGLNRVSYTGNQQLMKLNQTYIERTPLKGVYVGRLILKPKDPTKLFIYSFKKQKSNEMVYTSIFVDGQSKQVPFHRIRKMLKKKIKANFIHKDLKSFQNTYLKQTKVFDHDCVPPELGKKLTQNKPVITLPYKKQSFVEMILEDPQNKVDSKLFLKKQTYL